MIVSEHKLKSAADGLDISLVIVRPESEPKAVLQIAHGMCGFKERFMPMMEYMAAHGVACFANDHRGHGKSIRKAEDLGYMYEGGYEALASDMRMVYEFVSELCPTAPFYLSGHSMGALAAVICYREWGTSLSGLILCGLPLRPAMTGLTRRFLKLVDSSGGGRIRMQTAQKLTSWLYNRRFSGEGPQAWTCSDPSMRLTMEGGARSGFYFTVNASYNLMRMLDKAYSISQKKHLFCPAPVLLLAGEDDPCSGFASTPDIMSALLRSEGCQDVGIRKYPHMRHEILNEKGKEQVWHDILEFMLKETAE